MGPYRQSQLTTFTYSLGFRITWALLMLFPIFVLAAEPQRWRECLLGIAIFAVGNVVFNAEKVSIDEKMITYRGFIGWSTSIEWSDVTDIYRSPYLLVVSASRSGKRIKLRKGDGYPSIGPFDELGEEVEKRVGDRLAAEWERLSFPLTCRYSRNGLGPLAYLISSTLIASIYWLLRPLGFEISLITALFLATCLVIVPLFLRIRRTLVIDDNYLWQTNGKAIAISWREIENVIVKEGYPGSIVVESKGKLRISIPRSLPNIGQVAHFVLSRSGIKEEYGYEV